jgi:hypothetical protein
MRRCDVEVRSSGVDLTLLSHTDAGAEFIQRAVDVAAVHPPVNLNAIVLSLLDERLAFAVYQLRPRPVP